MPAQGPKDEDAIRKQFKEALDRKQHRNSGAGGSGGEEQTGKVHEAHGPAKAQRTFRRKSG